MFGVEWLYIVLADHFNSSFRETVRNIAPHGNNPSSFRLNLVPGELSCESLEAWE